MAASSHAGGAEHVLSRLSYQGDGARLLGPEPGPTQPGRATTPLATILSSRIWRCFAPAALPRAPKHTTAPPGTPPGRGGARWQGERGGGGRSRPPLALCGPPPTAARSPRSPHVALYVSVALPRRPQGQCTHARPVSEVTVLSAASRMHAMYTVHERGPRCMGQLHGALYYSNQQRLATLRTRSLIRHTTPVQPVCSRPGCRCPPRCPYARPGRVTVRPRWAGVRTTRTCTRTSVLVVLAPALTGIGIGPQVDRLEAKILHLSLAG